MEDDHPTERQSSEQQLGEQQPGERAGEHPDETAVDETAIGRRPAASDETAVDQTAVGRPPAEDTAVLPPATEPRPAVWSGRAAAPVRPRVSAPQEQWVPDGEPPRTWWLPIMTGLAVLLLVGLVGLGLWLALRGSAPVPSTTPSAVPTSATASPTPSPSASSPPPAVLVPVPPLTNVAVSDALPILQGQGLIPKVVSEVNDSVPPGTVIGTDPPAGTQVPVGSVVTVRVATPSPSSAAPSSSPPSPGPSG